MICDCGNEMEIISGDRDPWTVFKCSVCENEMKEPHFYPVECEKCRGGSCSDCGYFEKRKGQLQLNAEFWEKHRKSL